MRVTSWTAVLLITAAAIPYVWTREDTAVQTATMMMQRPARPRASAQPSPRCQDCGGEANTEVRGVCVGGGVLTAQMLLVECAASMGALLVFNCGALLWLPNAAGTSMLRRFFARAQCTSRQSTFSSSTSAPTGDRSAPRTHGVPGRIL
jgi:hypothetical protein